MLAANFLRPPAATASFAGEKGYRPRRTSHSLERSVASTYRAPYLSFSTPTAASGSGGVAEENIKVRKSILWTRGRSSILARVGSEPLATSGAGDGERAASSGLREFMVRAGEILSMAFPVWVSLACFLALWRPSSFLWFGQTWQIVGLTLTMLGMGMTLTLDDLRAAFLMPKEAITGFILQYSDVEDPKEHRKRKRVPRDGGAQRGKPVKISLKRERESSGHPEEHTEI